MYLDDTISRREIPGPNYVVLVGDTLTFGVAEPALAKITDTGVLVPQVTLAAKPGGSSATMSSGRSGSWPCTMRLAPALANSTAIARPIPLELPVTRAHFPVSVSLALRDVGAADAIRSALSRERNAARRSALAEVPIGRRIFIHVNNTNPALLADSPERAALEAAGWEVAYDGMEIAL